MAVIRIGRPKPKKRKGSGFKAAVHYTDTWFSRFIVLRDRRCVTCNSSFDLQCSHVFRRHSYATRWAVDNAYAQCWVCHSKHHSKYPGQLWDYVLRRIGQDAMDDLWLRSKTVSHFSADTIKAFGDSFWERCRGMER